MAAGIASDCNPQKFKIKLNKILGFFDSSWVKYIHEKQDVNMLNTMNNTDCDWPDNIIW